LKETLGRIIKDYAVMKINYEEEVLLKAVELLDDISKEDKEEVGDNDGQQG
jgi:hypothetical protein